MSGSQKNKQLHLRKLFTDWCQEDVIKMQALPAHGSSREYFRIEGKTAKAIGAYNEDRSENRAFLSFARYLPGIQI